MRTFFESVCRRNSIYDKVSGENIFCAKAFVGEIRACPQRSLKKTVKKYHLMVINTVFEYERLICRLACVPHSLISVGRAFTLESSFRATQLLRRTHYFVVIFPVQPGCLLHADQSFGRLFRSEFLPRKTPSGVLNWYKNVPFAWHYSVRSDVNAHTFKNRFL